ncbi:MAG: polyphosphate kinase 1 [Gammaproteobacteria bacterium]|nr:polyphosphate kinase 1 [Gammaproteobacteria bacterium]
MNQAPAAVSHARESALVTERPPAELYLNRYLSLLDFNFRVLELAVDSRVPPLERLRFLCISCSNLDEFFEIRVAGLKQAAQLANPQPGADGRTPAETLALVAERAHALVAQQYRILNEVLIPQLQAEGIRFVRRSDMGADQKGWLQHYFRTALLPVLSPLGLDPAHPFPRILNKSLNFIAALSGKDAFGRNIAHAIVQAPRALPRLIRLPREIPGTGANDFVFLSSIIHACVDELFPGMTVDGCYQFRVTRNADLLVDEEEAEDLLEVLEDELSQRNWGSSVRLEVAHNCPESLVSYLSEELGLAPADVYRCNGPVNLMRLIAIPDQVDRPELKYPPFAPRLPHWAEGDLFAAIRRQDRLLQHPYESFAPVLELLRAAARDPCVLAIKQTLYRTGADSPVVAALAAAARAGKEVTVVIELRARFDEAENIELAETLQEKGAHIVYGVVGYKTHAKMLLIVRREEGRLRQYAHLGTGNYHPRTALAYADYGLFTADAAICADVHAIFLQLTGLGKVSRLERLLQSPFTLSKSLLEKIEREAGNAADGRPARIIAKMNALVEPQMIRALYVASQSGVQIELIVRGMCSLRPGVPGLSDNIRVRSVLGRFLEHHRAFYFENGGEPELWLSSADWMERNLFRRVEIAFPIDNPELRRRLIADLEAYVADRVQSWVLTDNGSYLSPPRDRDDPSVQQRFLQTLARG